MALFHNLFHYTCISSLSLQSRGTQRREERERSRDTSKTMKPLTEIDNDNNGGREKRLRSARERERKRGIQREKQLKKRQAGNRGSCRLQPNKTLSTISSIEFRSTPLLFVFCHLLLLPETLATCFVAPTWGSRGGNSALRTILNPGLLLNF
ncbi:hypothetical protein K1719_007233 [Acacia pycnantha]|nr:hypothetical protein K1719_007233 [Acacia pycnantha]